MKKFMRTQSQPAPQPTAVGGQQMRLRPSNSEVTLPNGHGLAVTQGYNHTYNHNGHNGHNGHAGHNGHNAHNGHNGQANGHPNNNTHYHIKTGKVNGHANGVANGRTWMNGFASKPEDKQSTLSRYWTTERPRTGVSHYQAIKRACREKGILWEDPEFIAGPKALYKHKKPSLQPIVWMRPHEICQCPLFGSATAGSGSGSGSNNDAARLAVDVGELGDPWLLAAASSLALTPRFLERVVPSDQDFEENYSGMFRFRFWHFGEWKEVLIDDRLPTYRGRLIYLHSSTTTEFWAPLMEKAYAKLYGNYENLLSGSTTRSLQDLTGGIVQSFGLSHQDRYLTFQVLNSAVPRSSLLIATITPDKDKRQLRLRNGLLTQHAYSVTGLARVRGQGGETPLVRLRGARGRGHWAGAWSAGSWEWQGLSDRDRELLSVRVTNDGEFWMSFEDFSKHFTQLELVHVGPDDWMSEPALHSKQPWRAVLARRRWRAGYNAGGGPHYIETTAMNPQFHVQIPRATSNKCHVVVSVTQYYDTRPPEEKSGRKKPLVAIGFAVYEVPHSMPRLTPHFVADQKPLDVTNHSVAREVVTFFTLPPGDYIVVPQTNMPNIDGKFLLRIFTDEQSNIWEVNEDNMVLRNISAEFMDDSAPILPETKAMLSKLFLKYPPEVDASILQKILKSSWKSCLCERPSLELCRSLIMMRDYNISGRIHLRDIPALMHMLQFWKLAYQKYAGTQCGGKTSSYRLRPLLREAGATVSNKVLECLVLRFAKSRVLTAESYIMAMVRLHLAHERYHSLDTKMKTNPLSLEEMILMTIYS